jgi:hypothetical protein
VAPTTAPRTNPASGHLHLFFIPASSLSELTT